MKIYNTPQKDEGLPYPSSGQLLGWLAEGLGLKTWLRQEIEDQQLASSKTLQRYFSGDFIQDRQTIDSIVNLFVEQLFLDTQGAFGVTTLAWTAMLKNVLAEWDVLASALHKQSFPLHEPGDQVLVAMRLLLPEIACRAGIVLCLRHISIGISAEKTIIFNDKLFSKERIGYCIDSLKIKDETVEAFAQRCGASPQTVHGWKTGAHLPTSDNIESLAKALLTDHIPDDEYHDRFSKMTVELRFYRAISWFFNKLEFLVGDHFFEMISELLYRLTVASYLNFIHLFRANSGDQFFIVTGEILIRGTNSIAYSTWVETTKESLQNMHKLITNIAPKTFSYNFQEDLILWANNNQSRIERLQYWASKVGGVRAELSDVKKFPDQFLKNTKNIFKEEDDSSEKAEAFLNLVSCTPDILLSPYYQLLDHQLDSESIICHIPIPIELGGALYLANSRHAQGDLMGAIDALREAVKVMPQDPYHHFVLCSMLSDAIVLDLQKGHGLDISLYMEGKNAIEKAICLATKDGIFANELAVFLSRSGMAEDAENAFAAAEKVAGELSLYWFGRGVNILRLGEYRRGEQYIKKSLDCARDGEHADAYVFLSMLHMVNGNPQMAQRYGAKAEQRGQPNPYSWGREKCIHWLQSQNMWPPKD